MSKTETLSIDLIRLDGGSQARIKSSEETIESYAELIDASNGVWPLGPVDVFHDGSDYFLGDGFHRTLAALRLNRASMPCRIHKGTAKDAKIFGMTANDKHGLRMSQADKRACVEWLIDNGGKLTQAAIAEKAGVTDRTVKRIVAERKPQAEKGTLSPSASKTLGKSSEIDTKTTKEDQKPDSSRDFQDEPDIDVPFDSPESPTTETKPKNGAESISAASLVDALTKQHIGHIARGLTAIAKANRGEGKQFKAADAGLNQMITALQKMRDGEQ